MICTFKQGRIAERGHDAQQFRASGLNLVIAAIVYWNSTYIVDAIAHLHARGQPVPEALLVAHLAATWEHIGFSGDFLWDHAAATAGRRRPLNLEPQAAGRMIRRMFADVFTHRVVYLTTDAMPSTAAARSPSAATPLHRHRLPALPR